ncbi:MAG: lysophospholipid acyltransferase family protein, partial [Pseudomonadota bacterium]|nr:lysophospholipid acyltransferase family protein [Pseudomonadota bacterium]
EEVADLVVRVSGWSLVEAAQETGRGIIFLTPHLGCYEISAQYVARTFPITVLYRKPRQSWLAPLMEEGRCGSGASLQLASADLSGVRRLMKALKAGQAIGILPDQVPSHGEGSWASFFDRPAYTMTLASKLSKSSNATVLLAFAERLPYGAGYHLQFFTPEEDVHDAAALNREIERLIRLAPTQYLWGYNRYKRPNDHGNMPPRIMKHAPLTPIPSPTLPLKGRETTDAPCSSPFKGVAGRGMGNVFHAKGAPDP